MVESLSRCSGRAVGLDYVAQSIELPVQMEQCKRHADPTATHSRNASAD